MQGLTVADLVNLENLGQLTTNKRHTVFLAAKPKVDQLEQYQWTVYELVNHHQYRPLFTLDHQPSLLLVDHQLYWTVLVDDQTVLKAFNLETDSFERQWTLPAKLRLKATLSETKLLLQGNAKLQTQDSAWHEVTEVPYWSNATGELFGQRTHLWSFDLTTGQLTDLLPAKFNVRQTWLVDRRLFVVGASYDSVAPSDDGLYEYDFKARELTELLPSNRYRIDEVTLLADELFVVATDGQRYGINENPQFYRYDQHRLLLVTPWDQNVTNMVVNDMDVVGGNSTMRYQNRWYFVTTVGDHNELYFFDGKLVQRVLTWDGGITAFAFRDDELLLVADTAKSPQQIYAWQAGARLQLTHFNQFLSYRRVVAMEEIDYQDSTGRAVTGWVMPPVNYRPGKTYPAIVEVHGGPRAAYGKRFFHEMQVLANAGYFVLLTNLHGSEGQGNEYADVNGRYGTVDYEDLMAFVDAALARYHQIDGQRLGITGGSYGGFMTNWVVGHTNRFKAAVSERSIANWSSMMISDIGPRFVTDQMGTDLTQPDGMLRFWEHSPLKYVKNVETPTLLLHSDHDFRCPLPEAYQMFQALQLQGVPTKLVVFHGANHDLSRTGRPDQRMHRLQLVLQWFEQYL